MQYYHYGYSDPVRWVDPSGQAVRDPGREPTVCPPGMFAACYEAFDRQHANNPYLHPSQNANFAFCDAYHDEALAYDGSFPSSLSPAGKRPYELALWRSQYRTALGTTIVDLAQSSAAECGSAAGIAGMAEGATELNKNLAGANRGSTSLGIQQDADQTNRYEGDELDEANGISRSAKNPKNTDTHYEVIDGQYYFTADLDRWGGCG